jgi:multidrug resistance efflux pump
MPTKRTVAELEKNLSRIRAHGEKRLEGIRARIAKLEASGLNAEHLYRELDQARRTVEAGEALAARNLAEAQAIENAELARQAQAEKAMREAIDAAHKARAAQNWAKVGGSPAEFEAAWPGIRAEIVTQKTLELSAREILAEVGFDSL